MQRHIPLLVLLLLTSCTFTSDEEYFENIEPPDPARITIELPGYASGDTIHIYESTKFRYKIDANGGRIKSVTVSANGVPYVEGPSPTGEFTIYETKPAGIYEILLEFNSTSGTGSLADVLGAEGFVGTKKWIIVAHFERPSAPIVDLRIVDGLLKVSWTPYTKPNFERYRVYRYYNNKSYGTEIIDATQNYWFDDGYTGGPLVVRYIVTVENSIGSNTSEASYSHSPNVRFDFNKNDTTLTLQWSKNPFYRAFKEYEIKTLPDVTAIITQIDDTVKTFKLDNLVFGSQSTVLFEVNASENDILYNSVQQSFTLGDSLPDASMIYYSQFIQSYILDQGYPKNPLVLNDNFEVTGELKSNQGIQVLPYPGRYYYNFSYDRINMVDIVTGEVKSRVTGTTVSGWDGAGNGTILIRGFYRNFGKFYYSSSVEDILTGKKLYTDGSSSTLFNVGALPINLADDGKRFIALTEKEVFNVIPGDTSVLVGDLPSGKLIGFRADDSNEIMFSNESSISLFDASALDLLRTVGPPEGGFSYISYDPQTKYMLWKKPNSSEAYLVHIETGSFKRTKVGSGALLLNGHLFIPDSGLYIKVL